MIRRRIPALIAALCVVATQVDVLLPDAHDGDVPASHVSGTGTHEEPARSPAGTPASQSEHAAHVDHCAHAHVFASGTSPAATSLSVSGRDVPATAPLALASVGVSPLTRPPIA